MRIFFYILVLIAILIGIIFALLNSATVAFNYYWGVTQMPLSLLLAGTLVLGVFLGWFLSLKIIIRSKRKHYALKSQLSKVKKS